MPPQSGTGVPYMKLVTFEAGGKVSWGVVAGDGIINLGAKLGGKRVGIRRRGRLAPSGGGRKPADSLVHASV